MIWMRRLQIHPLPQHAHHGIDPVVLSCDPVEIRRGCGRCDRDDKLVDDSGDDDMLCVVVRSTELPPPPPPPPTTAAEAAAFASEPRRRLKRRFEIVAVAAALADVFECACGCWFWSMATGILLRRGGGGRTVGGRRELFALDDGCFLSVANGAGARVTHGNFGLGGLSGLGGKSGFQPMGGAPGVVADCCGESTLIGIAAGVTGLIVDMSPSMVRIRFISERCLRFLSPDIIELSTDRLSRSCSRSSRLPPVCTERLSVLEEYRKFLTIVCVLCFQLPEIVRLRRCCCAAARAPNCFPHCTCKCPAVRCCPGMLPERLAAPQLAHPPETQRSAVVRTPVRRTPTGWGRFSRSTGSRNATNWARSIGTRRRPMAVRSGWAVGYPDRWRPCPCCVWFPPTRRTSRRSWVCRVAVAADETQRQCWFCRIPMLAGCIHMIPGEARRYDVILGE